MPILNQWQWQPRAAAEQAWSAARRRSWREPQALLQRPAWLGGAWGQPLARRPARNAPALRHRSEEGPPSPAISPWKNFPSDAAATGKGAGGLRLRLKWSLLPCVKHARMVRFCKPKWTPFPCPRLSSIVSSPDIQLSRIKGVSRAGQTPRHAPAEDAGGR